MRNRAAPLLALSALLWLFGTTAIQAASRTRSVTGVVVDRRGNALKGAAVQIENSRSLAIASYLTRADGRYYFHQLDPDLDYTLTAKYKRWWSKSKTLSKFDSKVEGRVDLEVPVE